MDSKISVLPEPPPSGILKQSNNLPADVPSENGSTMTVKDLIEIKSSTKKVRFATTTSSHVSSSSSTRTGDESPTHPLSDSDSDVETYRLKSVLRGELKGPVYVYGSRNVQEIDKTAVENRVLLNKSNGSNSKSTSSVRIAQALPSVINNQVEAPAGNKDQINDNVGPTVPKQIKTEPDTNYLKSNAESQDQMAPVAEAMNVEVKTLLNEIIDRVLTSTSRSKGNPACQDGVVALTIKKEVDEPEGKSNGGAVVKVKQEPLCHIENDEQPHLAFFKDVLRIKLSLDDLAKHKDYIPLEDLRTAMISLDASIRPTQVAYREENEKRKKYQVDDCRRRHDYDPFICTFLTMLAEQGHLTQLIEQQNTVPKRFVTNISAQTKKAEKKPYKKRKKK